MRRRCPLLSSYAATLPLLWAGTDAVRSRWLTSLAAGEAIAALALVGAERRRAAAAPSPPSRRLDALGHEARGAVRVRRRRAGGERRPRRSFPRGDRGRRARCRVGARHDTFAPDAVRGGHVRPTCPWVATTSSATSRVLERALAHQTVVDTAYAVGLAGGALALAVDHASNREQFGRPIGVNQAVSHQCVDMRVRDRRHAGPRVAGRVAARPLRRRSHGRARAVALANAYARDVLPGIFARAHQVHGAIGFTMEYDLQLFTRRAKAYELTGGGAAQHLERVARSIGLD